LAREKTMRIIRTLSIGIATLALSIGCAQHSQPPKTEPIIASTVVGGHRVPYGRSDTAEPFTSLVKNTKDATYGYSKDNPIKVGGRTEGPQHEKRYLNGLRGPAGEVIEYERIGSCCPFNTPNGFMGGGMLDAFQITYPGQPGPITLYLNLYDNGDLSIPVGFTARH
jgi:hypothetical protein